MKKIKKLCGIKKADYDSLQKEIFNIVKKPSYICSKCLRVANDKKHLCKGKEIK